jgi:hypothetical protein
MFFLGLCPNLGAINGHFVLEDKWKEEKVNEESLRKSKVKQNNQNKYNKVENLRHRKRDPKATEKYTKITALSGRKTIISLFQQYF